MNIKSGTVVLHEETKKQDKSNEKVQQPSTLILRLQHKPIQRVSWTQNTIDNEHMNKKKSNLCCIYHRPGQSSSDTCTSDDQGNALQRDRHTKHQHKKVCSKRKNKPQQKKSGNCCNKDDHHHNHQTKHEKKFIED